MPVTKAEFLRAYRERLRQVCPWAQDDTKLNRFTESCRATIASADVCTWNHDGEIVTEVWRALGFKGKPTLKALRALPEA